MKTDDKLTARFVYGVIAACRDKQQKVHLKREFLKLATRNVVAPDSVTFRLMVKHEVFGDVKKIHPNALLPFAIVAGAIAVSLPETNGKLPFGAAIFTGDDTEYKSNPMLRRLKIIMQCQELNDALPMLCAIIKAIKPDVLKAINFMAMLDNLRRFDFDSEAATKKWIMDYVHASYKKEQASEATCTTSAS